MKEQLRTRSIRLTAVSSHSKAGWPGSLASQSGLLGLAWWDLARAPQPTESLGAPWGSQAFPCCTASHPGPSSPTTRCLLHPLNLGQGNQGVCGGRGGAGPAYFRVQGLGLMTGASHPASVLGESHKTQLAWGFRENVLVNVAPSLFSQPLGRTPAGGCWPQEPRPAAGGWGLLLGALGSAWLSRGRVTLPIEPAMCVRLPGVSGARGRVNPAGDR